MLRATHWCHQLDSNFLALHKELLAREIENLTPCLSPLQEHQNVEKSWVVSLSLSLSFFAHHCVHPDGLQAQLDWVDHHAVEAHLAFH